MKFYTGPGRATCILVSLAATLHSGTWLRARRAAPILALVLLNVCFYWKLVLTRQYCWFDTPDMAYIEVPRLQMQAKELQSSRFPFWDPYVWAGQPLIGQTQPGPFFPLNLLFMLMPRKSAFIQFSLLNAHYVLLHSLASIFLYVLLRDWGRTRWASLFGGCLYSFAGFIGAAPWLDVLNGALWTPLIFLHAFRSVSFQSGPAGRPWAHAALSGLWLGLAWLSGHHEIPLLVTLLLAATWGWQILKTRRVLVAALAAVSLGCGVLIGAAQMLPTYEFGRLSLRWAGLPTPIGWKDLLPYTVATSYSLPASALLRLAWPLDSDPAASTPFAGIAAVSLAALGLRAGWHDIRARWAMAAAAFGLLYALGAGTPVHGLLYALVPALEKARVPARALHLAGFGLAILAAYGLDGLRSRIWPAWARSIERAALACGALILASAAILALALKSEWSHGVLMAAYAACATAALCAAWRHWKVTATHLSAALLAVAICEWYGVAAPHFPNQYDASRQHFLPALTGNQDIAQYLRRESARALSEGRAPVRAAVNEADIPANFGDWNAIEVLQGYVAGVPANLVRAELHTRRSHDLYGVTHWIGRDKLWPDHELVFSGASGVRVWRNPTALPRAWVVHEAVRRASAAFVLRAVQLEQIDFRRQAVTDEALPALESCEGDQVRYEGWSTDRIKLSVEARCRGVLVLADPQYPGWQALVDGRETSIHEIYGAARGVVVEAGAHTVEFRFRPASVYTGLALSAAGLCLVLLFNRFDRG